MMANREAVGTITLNPNLGYSLNDNLDNERAACYLNYGESLHPNAPDWVIWQKAKRVGAVWIKENYRGEPTLSGKLHDKPVEITRTTTPFVYQVWRKK